MANTISKKMLKRVKQTIHWLTPEDVMDIYNASITKNTNFIKVDRPTDRYNNKSKYNVYIWLEPLNMYVQLRLRLNYERTFGRTYEDKFKSKYPNKSKISFQMNGDTLLTKCICVLTSEIEKQIQALESNSVVIYLPFTRPESSTDPKIFRANILAKYNDCTHITTSIFTNGLLYRGDITNRELRNLMPDNSFVSCDIEMFQIFEFHNPSCNPFALVASATKIDIFSEDLEPFAEKIDELELNISYASNSSGIEV